MDLTLVILATIAFVTILALLQWWFVAHGQPTISARITALYRRLPIVGVFAGLVVGALIGHFFWCDCP